MVTERAESNLPSVSPTMDQLSPMLEDLSPEERDQIIQVMQRDQVFHSSSAESVTSSISISSYSASISAHSSLLSDNLSPKAKTNVSNEIISNSPELNRSSSKAADNQSSYDYLLKPIASEEKTTILEDNLAQKTHNNHSFESISLSSANGPEDKECCPRRTSAISSISESNSFLNAFEGLNNPGDMTLDLSVLAPEEQRKILEVIRKDTILQLYIDLKVR